MYDHEATIRRFFDCWGVSYAARCASLHDHFTEECEWINVSMSTTYGPLEAVNNGLRPGRDQLGIETMAVDMTRLCVDGDVVWTERVDHARRADGTLIGSVDCVGIMEMKEGRIRRWRDFFDTSQLEALLTAGTP